MMARRVLLVTDPGVIAAGWLMRSERILRMQESNRLCSSADRQSQGRRSHGGGCDVCQRALWDVIVALGGGSVIDCAKGIGIVHTNGRPIVSFEGWIASIFRGRH